MDKGLLEIHESLKKKEVTSTELIKESLEKAHEIQEKTNAFVTIIDDAKEVEVTDEILSGIPYGVKDNYSTKGILSTGSSNTLKNYVPFFTATAVENLEKKGAVAIGKTTLDELWEVQEQPLILELFIILGTTTVCVQAHHQVQLHPLQQGYILMHLEAIRETLFVNLLHTVEL